MGGEGVEGGKRLVMRDLMDNALEAADGRHLGRVDDLAAEWREDGRLFLTEILCGPEALLTRVGSRLRALGALVLRGRLESRLPIGEIQELGPTVKLRQPSGCYQVGKSDEWIARHLLRWIPGSGRW